MRCLFVLVFVGGCGFEHGSLGGSTQQDDAAVQVVDAAVDARMIDASIDAPKPPDSCDDDDGDSVCNTVDDWPCGAKPPSPPSTVQFMNNNGATITTFTLINLNNTGRMAVAAPGSTIGLGFRLQITDTACSGNCQDQIEAGWINAATNTGNRFSTCLFDNVVSKQNGLDTTLAFTVGTPSTPRVYDLRVNLGQNFFCGANGNNGWWPGNSVPPDSKTIARLCVH